MTTASHLYDNDAPTPGDSWRRRVMESIVERALERKLKTIMIRFSVAAGLMIALGLGSMLLWPASRQDNTDTAEVLAFFVQVESMNELYIGAETP